jgi:hypothetical protein
MVGRDVVCGIIEAVRQKECWYVDIGGFAAHTFSLHLGRRFKRPSPVGRDLTAEIALYDGEVNIYVWCAWRLDGPTAPLSSWDDTELSIVEALQRLKGETILEATINTPAWDLDVVFSNALTLRVFCDHVPGQPSYSGNWDIRFGGKLVAFGPGAEYRVQDEEDWWKAK